MRHSAIIMTCGIVVMAFAFLIFSYGRGISSFAVYDGNASMNSTLPAGIASGQDAINAIKNAENTIDAMKGNNFSVAYASDLLVQANQAFQQAKYAEILRSQNASAPDRMAAEQALSLIHWENINYSGVFAYTDEINARAKRAIDIFDALAASDTKISQHEANGVNGSDARALLGEARTAFYEDRYDDAEALVQNINSNLETASSNLTSANTLQASAQNFIARNWLSILIALAAAGFAGWIIYRKTGKRAALNKIEGMKAEKKVLVELMKKAQNERFNENKLSGIVYNIRMKKYKEKLNRISEMLPVLEQTFKSKYNSRRTEKKRR